MSAHATYQVVEPHPTPSSTSGTRPSFHTGRGGTGNVFHLPSDASITSGQSATGPAAATILDKHVPKTYKTGRGGAGNVHPASERAIFSFDEELERQLRRENAIAPVYHVGRGGAGNMVYGQSGSRKNSRSDTGSVESRDSNTSDSVTQRARRSLEKGWEKIVGH
jgi:hypothetical protein